MEGPYNIAVSDTKGRHVVAKRALKAGETILETHGNFQVFFCNLFIMLLDFCLTSNQFKLIDYLQFLALGCTKKIRKIIATGVYGIASAL